MFKLLTIMGRGSQASTFNEVKALNAVVFIATLLTRDCGKHGVSKTLYSAEKKHLARYGRTICGDRIIKMKYGPINSNVLDFMKANNHTNLFAIEGDRVVAVAEVDLDVFSDSEIDCIQEAIEENNDLSFRERTDKSHDSAWEAAEMHKDMDLIKIAEAGGADHKMLRYIQQVLNYKNFTQ